MDGLEATCQRCGGPNVSWCAPSPLWNAVMRGGDINGEWEFGEIICPTCFVVLAAERGVVSGQWRLSAAADIPLQTVTPSGRIWDESTWLWVDGPYRCTTCLEVIEDFTTDSEELVNCSCVES